MTTARYKHAAMPGEQKCLGFHYGKYYFTVGVFGKFGVLFILVVTAFISYR